MYKYEPLHTQLTTSNIIIMITLMLGPTSSSIKQRISVTHGSSYLDKKFKLIFLASFPKWWSTHGPTTSILPKMLTQKVNHFQSSYNRDKIDIKLPLL